MPNQNTSSTAGTCGDAACGTVESPRCSSNSCSDSGQASCTPPVKDSCCGGAKTESVSATTSCCGPAAVPAEVSCCGAASTDAACCTPAAAASCCGMAAAAPSAATIAPHTYRIPTMDCSAEESDIRRAVEPVAGVKGLHFQLGARTLRIDGSDEAVTLALAAIKKAGFAP